ncbi:MAG: copper resistance protein CopD [Parahaliea sp.]
MYSLLLVLHILGATIWTGGHIVLSCAVLPRVLRERSPQRLIDFEQAYEKIGMLALLVQVVTGLMLAYQFLPDLSQWMDFSNPLVHLLMFKLTLLLITVLFALDARFRVLPGFDEHRIVSMAWHIIPVTILSILFVIAGVSLRAGWLF